MHKRRDEAGRNHRYVKHSTEQQLCNMGEYALRVGVVAYSGVSDLLILVRYHSAIDVTILSYLRKFAKFSPTQNVPKTNLVHLGVTEHF